MKLIPHKNEYFNMSNFRRITLHGVHPTMKKSKEITHVGKFLMHFGSQANIEEITEKPDFIISINNQRIGLEHTELINESYKQTEGFIDSIIKNAEKLLLKEPELPTQLITVQLNQFISTKTNDKKLLIKQIADIVKQYTRNGKLIENQIIDDIESMEHDRFALNVNQGGWWQDYLTKGLLEKTISKKELKIKDYINNTGLPQWLLIVIGGVYQSSYVFKELLDFKAKTRFEKVYVLEDSYNKLYEI
ncbi:MAG TPA: hypothetical protein GXX42_10150 [Petrimonas sp.]|uniref:hypothetical protein n=1 Tax=Petrimonas sp. TaxID=2023866 RepID=UPI00174FA57A|nr:hypothetical protein [Petrimonas sp.]